MAPPTPRLVETIDLKKRPWEQALALHNRWHPEIPPVTCVKDGKAAVPGDLLAVEICSFSPLPGVEWGCTTTFDRENGGFLTDHLPCGTKAIWGEISEMTRPGIIGMSLVIIRFLMSQYDNIESSNGHLQIKKGPVEWEQIAEEAAEDYSGKRKRRKL
ncbi:hypothetical protein V6N13_107578 [Hibiscus sabdariffa]|uniref:Formamidase n=1 Tax=Hibiscus sabdariffa TaxID=183260 RepID=A0ABR2SPV0_9ROSI